MAFTVSQQWNTSRTEASLGIFRAFLEAISISLPDHPMLQTMRKPIAIAMSVVLHIAILWALLNTATFSAASLRNLRDTASQLTVFEVKDVPPPPPPPPEISKTDQRAKQAHAVRSSQVNVTDTVALPPEWSKSLILIGANSSPVSGTSGTLDGQVHGGSNGSDKKGVFDPYAGAAPRRQFTDPNALSAANIDLGLDADPMLDQQAFKRWVLELRYRLQGATGTFALTVVVGENGDVRIAEVSGGEASMQLQLFIRADAIGRQLFVSNAQGARRLPTIQL